MKNKIVLAALICLLMAAGLFFVGCEKEKCSGRCHQDTDQDTYGLWLGCTVLDHTCATSSSGGCAAYQDWINKIPAILSRGCNCN